ncbi:MAG TPA: nitroreductase family protein [Vicinamibacteria bacterium]|nr:nitroreductase family protein [Vicinamibacteria bacterium]
MSGTEAYDSFLTLVKARHSCRRFRSDPIPDGHVEKLLEAARWAMSGANAQPWEFIVVRDPETTAKLYRAYQDHMNELNFWLEQRFPYELRHPGFRLDGDVEAQLEALRARPGWSKAPALIVVLGDGRRQLASVSGASTPGRHQTHLTDALSIAETHIHLAATALGLATQWVSIHIPDPFKQILNVPPILTMHTIIPVGYPEQPLTGSVRRKLVEIVHEETYDETKFMSTRQVVENLYQLRAATIRVYRRSRGEKQPNKKDDEA